MTPAEDEALLDAARHEAQAMRAALARMQPGGAIQLQREQFVRLAMLIDQLAARETSKAGDGFDTPIDGIRWWVPLPEVERDRAELARLRAQQCEGLTFDFRGGSPIC